MKKKYIILFSFLFLFLLGGCAGNEAPVSDPGGQALPADLALPRLACGESLEMMNFMNVNRALVLDERLYCLDFGNDWQPVLAEYALYETGPERLGILADDCVPEYLAQQGGRLYYINPLNGDAIESICLDGSGRQVLNPGPCSFLRLIGDHIYYCDAAGRFCRAEGDGSGEFVLLDESCAFPYLIGEKLLYQAEDGSLRLRNLDSGQDAELTEGPAGASVIYGDRLFCPVPGRLISMGLDGRDRLDHPLPEAAGAELLIENGELAVRGVSDENGPRQWAIQAGDAEKRPEYAPYAGWRFCDYIDENLRLDAAYNPDGRLSRFVLSGGGTEFEFIAGKTGAEVLR